MSIVRGSYNATWNSLSVGNTEIGFRHSYNYRGRTINFDAIGETPVDTIFAGMTMTVDFVAQEYDAAAVDSLRWPFNATIGQLAPAGQSLWELARPLVLTACGSTAPSTITFYKTILAPDFDLDIDYSHRERPLPMRLIVFPVRAGATSQMPSGCNDIIFFVEA